MVYSSTIFTQIRRIFTKRFEEGKASFKKFFLPPKSFIYLNICKRQGRL